MAGQRIGYVQAAIMVVGFVLLTGWMLLYIYCIMRFMFNPSADNDSWRAPYRQFAWAWKSGLGLSLLAWCWSLVSSLRFLRPSVPPKLPPS